MLASLALAIAAPISLAPPALTVVISIDQFRRDYLGRFSDLYLPPGDMKSPGGFRFLMERGANFINSKYSHVPTFTGPGHAIIGTGSTPGLNGIVDNVWFDRVAGKAMYCVADAGAKDILTGKESMSPRNLMVSTFGDELKVASGGKSKNIAIALKDRAAILMAGRLADDVIWFDGAGSWTSSDFYEPSGRLADWVIEINARKIPETKRGATWSKSLPASAHERTRNSRASGASGAFGKTFPHTLADDDRFISNWTRTPYANDFVFETAKAAVAKNAMGQDGVPDVLYINLSTNDYIGHMFGPDSPEALEIQAETDRDLADFFKYLSRTVPGGLGSVAIVVTADHGVLPIPEDISDLRLPGGRVHEGDFRKALETAVTQRFGLNLIQGYSEYMIYLDRSKLNAAMTASDVEAFIQEYLRGVPSVEQAFTRTQLEGGVAGATMLEGLMAISFNRIASGDVMFFMRPGYLLDSGSTGTSHGAPWSYDSQVPLLIWSAQIEPGRHTVQCGPVDIAATVCALLGIGEPSGSVGRAIGLRR
jgi:predicted AlkP superfamily pyrophosphatase or phosphodiesterase